jgi:hypothetical protein
MTCCQTGHDRGTIWRFTEPGYYGLCKGTNRARGVIDSLQCHRVTQADGSQRLQWVNHATGTFSLIPV